MNEGASGGRSGLMKARFTDEQIIAIIKEQGFGEKTATLPSLQLDHYSGQGKLRTAPTGSKGSASSARHLTSETRGTYRS